MEIEVHNIKDAYDVWVVRYVMRRYRRPDARCRRFENDVVEQWGDRSVASITHADVSGLLRTVSNRAPSRAVRLLGDIKHFFGYCVERGWRADNPAAGITGKSIAGIGRHND